MIDVRKWASSFLEKNGRESRVADLMLMHLLQVEWSEFLMMQQDELSEDVYRQLQLWVEEHAATGKPLEHFTNEAEFYGRKFYVDKHVLIPRPETEELVVEVIEQLRDRTDDLVIADLGTGSGVIALTLKAELREAEVYATDFSENALRVARKNANLLGEDVHFYQGDFLQPLMINDVAPNVVVSNPPYIPESERVRLSETVLHDPGVALFADSDGLAAYEMIIGQVMQLGKRPELVVFEIGHDQGESVPALIRAIDREANVRVVKDINGKDRIVVWHVG
ncbi:peptide chain release factor N(5)-glutamine methyltransferase [Halalkalibacillus sediminis]|nr:peptide chain release factor N(5)-glutamine methyltransferase [Halalkalibacillus sediminis]